MNGASFHQSHIAPGGARPRLLGRRSSFGSRLLIVGSLVLSSLVVSQSRGETYPGCGETRDPKVKYCGRLYGVLPEFGTTSSPPLTDLTGGYFRVAGSGAVNLRFRLTADFGDFLYSLGVYRRVPELDRIDLDTDSGKEQFAALALAPGNAQLVFDDVLDDPGAVQEITAQGGDVLGFFLIPDASLEQFQTNQAAFAVDGVAAFDFPGNERWPLFSWSDANPGSLDQMIGLYGTSTLTGKPTSMFAFEDLTRANIPGNRLPSDRSFSDIVFTVEGIRAVPEPASLVLLATGAAGLAVLRRKRLSYEPI